MNLRQTLDDFENEFHESIEMIGAWLTSLVQLHKKRLLLTIVLGGAFVSLIAMGLKWQKKQEEAALFQLYDLKVQEKKILAPSAAPENPEAAPEAPSIQFTLKSATIKPLVDGYRDGIQKFSKTKAVRFFHFYLANLLFRSGQTTEALAEYEIFLRAFQTSSPYRGMGLVSAAVSAYEIGQYDKVKRYIAEVNTLEGNPQRGFALYILGKTYEKLGDTANAQLQYETITREIEHSLATDLARDRLWQLNKSGLVPAKLPDAPASAQQISPTNVRRVEETQKVLDQKP